LFQLATLVLCLIALGLSSGPVAAQTTSCEDKCATKQAKCEDKCENSKDPDTCSEKCQAAAEKCEAKCEGGGGGGGALPQYCCTPGGRFGPFPNPGIPEGGPCYANTPYGTVTGQACR